MSVDLVNAQMAEVWQVQRKRWKSQLRQVEIRDGQSSNVLRNQNMLHIVSENEKSLRVRILDTKPQNVSKLVTTLGRFHYDGDISGSSM